MIIKKDKEIFGFLKEKWRKIKGKWGDEDGDTLSYMEGI